MKTHLSVASLALALTIFGCGQGRGTSARICGAPDTDCLTVGRLPDDAGIPDAADAGIVADAGVSLDAGQLPADTGVGFADAAPPPADTGVGFADATPPADSGITADGGVPVSQFPPAICRCGVDVGCGAGSFGYVLYAQTGPGGTLSLRPNGFGVVLDFNVPDNGTYWAAFQCQELPFTAIVTGGPTGPTNVWVQDAGLTFDFWANWSGGHPPNPTNVSPPPDLTRQTAARNAGSRRVMARGP